MAFVAVMIRQVAHRSEMMTTPMQSQKATDSTAVRSIGRNARLAKNATTPGSSQMLPTTTYVAPLTPYLGTNREIRDSGLDNPTRTDRPQRSRST